jgi:hypothetical protein
MKKIIVSLFVVLAFVAFVVPANAQLNAWANFYTRCMLNAGWTQSDIYGIHLPKIAGTWYFVDPDTTTFYGRYTNDGKTLKTAFSGIDQAYDAVTDGAGDGIVLISRVTGSTTTSFIMPKGLVWAKSNCTIFGLASREGYNGRVRISVGSTGDSLAALFYFTGRDIEVDNVSFVNVVDCQTYSGMQTTQHGAIQVSSPHLHFVNCYFNAYEVNTAGSSINTYAAYLTPGVIRHAGADECTYDRCFFGSSSYDPGNTACAWIYNDGADAQNFYNDCVFLQQVGSGTAFGGYKNSAITVLNGLDFFRGCTFGIWRASTHANIAATWMIGSTPTTGNIVMTGCTFFGFTHLQVQGAATVWTDKPAGAVDGGVTVSAY